MQHAAERRSLTTGCSRRYSAAAERGRWMDEIGTIKEADFPFLISNFSSNRKFSTRRLDRALVPRRSDGQVRFLNNGLKQWLNEKLDIWNAEPAAERAPGSDWN